MPVTLDGLAPKGDPGKNTKLGWHLARLLEADDEARAQGQAITARTPSLLPKNLRDLLAAGLMRINEVGEVQVYVGTGDPASAAAQVTLALGGRIERQDAALGITQAWLPIQALDDLAADPAVGFVRLPNYGFVQTGSVLSEGDAALNADEVRSNLGVDGGGLTVGVISDGVGGIGTAQGSGDLPAVDYTTCNVVAPADPLATGAEGTAMLEIVHDLAPRASLMFGHFGMGTSLDFNAAVNCLAQNADVVVDDIGWFNAGPYDGTSSVSQNTADALNHVGWPIRFYATSVGNSADIHYQEPYVDSGVVQVVGLYSYDLHEWSATGNTTAAGLVPDPNHFDRLQLLPGGVVSILLQWNDPWGGSGNDYDILADDGSGVFLCSGYIQDGDDYPAEGCGVSNPGGTTIDVDIYIGNYMGWAASRTFDMFLLCYGCVLQPNWTSHNFNTAGSSVSNQADAGGGVMSLGAIDQADSGLDDIEYFSSRGPTNAPSPRTKPDITTVDGVCITGAGGFGTGGPCSPPQGTGTKFYGTSAASPHAAGVAALLLQCDPSLDRAGLRSALLTTAVDLGDLGTDNTFGAGRLDALVAALSGLCPDPDGDQLTDVIDNCPDDYNPGQENADAAIDNGPGIPGDDTTVSNAAADDEGDACETDGDIDNDGLADVDEDPLDSCGAFNGITGTHLNPAAGDITYDDDGNGNPTPPMGTDDDGSDSGPSWDTDGDGVLDGAECALGYNPRDGASKPTVEECGGIGDTDNDGLQDAWETCGWGTDPDLLDSDEDTLNDCREIGDVDGNEFATISDVIFIAKAALIPSPPTKSGDFDVDKNGFVTISDVVIAAKIALIAGFCPF